MKVAIEAPFSFSGVLDACQSKESIHLRPYYAKTMSSKILKPRKVSAERQKLIAPIEQPRHRFYSMTLFLGYYSGQEEHHFPKLKDTLQCIF